MPTFANEEYFGPASLSEASSGIILPSRRELKTGTVIYRFGNTEDLALLGLWWLDEEQFERTRLLAAQNYMSMPLMVRALCAIAHTWGEMRVLIRARVKVPLLAHEGYGKPQVIPGETKKRPKETFLPPTSADRGGVLQLYIPGMRRSEVNEASLTRMSTEHFSEGASHIFGVPGVPPGTIMQ